MSEWKYVRFGDTEKGNTTDMYLAYNAEINLVSKNMTDCLPHSRIDLVARDKWFIPIKQIAACISES